MANSKTRSNKRLGSYTTLFSRTKKFLPAAPVGMPAHVRCTGRAGAGDTTTTVYLYAIGDQTKAMANLNNVHVVLPRLAAASDEVCLWWRIPDDFYSGEKTHVWLVFACDGPTTTTVRVPYTIVYNAKKTVDYSLRASVTGETITEADTALDTAISETIKTDGLVSHAQYRGERGTINGGKLATGDIVTLKVEAGTPVSNGTMSIVGIEIDYAYRLREGVIEQYDD